MQLKVLMLMVAADGWSWWLQLVDAIFMVLIWWSQLMAEADGCNWNIQLMVLMLMGAADGWSWWLQLQFMVFLVIVAADAWWLKLIAEGMSELRKGSTVSCRMYSWASASRPLPPASAGSLIPVSDGFRHRRFVHSGTGLIRCRTVRHSGIDK